MQKLVIKWRKYDILVCIFAILGLILCITEYEISFPPNRNYYNCAYNSNIVLKWITFVFNIFATIYAILRFNIQQKLYNLQRKNHYKEHYKHLFQRKSVLYIILLFELIVIWIFPYPFLEGKIHITEINIYIHKPTYNVCYTYSEILLIIMTSRIYFIAKCILNNFSYRDIFSSYYCNKFDTRAEFRFT